MVETLPLNPGESGPAVERLLFRGRCPGRDALERIPQLGVAARLLVRREVTLEHAALGTEPLDAGLDVLPPCGGQLRRRRRHVALMEVETERCHAEATELHVHIRALRQLARIIHES